MNRTKTSYALIFTLLCAVSSLFAQPWDGSFGPVNLSDKIVTASSGFCMSTNVSNNTALELIKVTVSGGATLNWRKIYPTGLTQLRQNFRGISDASGGFLLANVGFNVNRWELVVIKTSQTGTQQWIKKFPLPAAYEVGDVLWASDGTYIIVGGTNLDKMWATKISSAGNLVWASPNSIRVYEQANKAWAVKNFPGGGYLVAGSKRVSRIWNDGVLMWTQPVNLPNDPNGTPYNGYRERILTMQSNGFAIVGTAKNGAYSAIYHAKFNWSAGQEFRTIYDETQTLAPALPIVEISNISRNTPNNALIVYKKGNAQAGNLTGALNGILIDLNGNIQTSGPIGNTTQVLFGDYIQAIGWFAFGSTSTANQYNVFLRNTVPWIPFAGHGADRDAADDAPASISIAPNPATDALNIAGDFADGGFVRLLALDGREAFAQIIQPGEATLRLDVSSLPRGLFLLEIESNNGQRKAQKIALN